MFELILPFIIIFILFNLLNFVCVKNNILIDLTTKLNHKKLTNKKYVPITGGILIVFSLFFLLLEISLINKLIFALIFILGLLSDTNKLSSPKIRFYFQIFIVFVYIILNETYINEIRLNYIDNHILNILIFKIIFTSFCLLVLINGSNFVDGVNTLNSGYFLIVFINILFISSNNLINLDTYNIKILIITLFIFLFSNIFSKSFLGDSGSYIIGFFTGIFLIEMFNKNSFISPYYVVILLWYPAFENFFTLTRRFVFEKNKIKVADNLHLHHLLFKFLKGKTNNNMVNTYTGLIINLFNLIIIFLAHNYIFETQKLVIILFLSIFIYLASYFYLKKKIN